MKTNIGISISEPCTQNWEGMTPNAEGRFCKMCSKSVVDVTGWTDEKIAETHAKNNNQLCIRIPNEQLNKAKKSSVKPNIYKAVLISLLLFFAKLPVLKAFIKPISAPLNPNIGEDKSTKITIRGTVYDTTQTENEIAFATIVILNGDKIIATAFTNAEGQYSINISIDSSIGDSLTLECSHLSYATFTQKVKIQIQTITHIDVYLKESAISLRTVVITAERRITMGIMTMGPPIITTTTRSLFLDRYDTKTFYQQDLQRYNLNRD